MRGGSDAGGGGGVLAHEGDVSGGPADHHDLLRRCGRRHAAGGLGNGGRTNISSSVRKYFSWSALSVRGGSAARVFGLGE